MRTQPLALVGLSALMLLVGSGVAVAQAPGQDFAVGEVVAGPGCEVPSECLPFASFDFSATSGPSGEGPAGHMINHIGGGLAPTFTGEVTCLSVTGNRAVIGAFGVLDFPSPGFPDDEIAEWTLVVDGGGPGSRRDTILIEDVFDSTPPTDCSRPPVFRGPEYVVAGGDVVVHDAQPLPTSKEQCKHGGWRSFGFKNQGRCVAFVQRGPQALVPGP
jgi:hypothetical protein